MSAPIPRGASDEPYDGAAAPEGPRLELDQLLSQLVDRAPDVMAAQSRLRGLLRANRVIMGDLALPLVLRRIVEAACTLVGAPYGALGVMAAGGGLEQFVYAGIDQERAAGMGHLPEGKGLLGALIEDPRPLLRGGLTKDPRSVGFPGHHHPAMRSFLGVPIRVRGSVFGSLYLAAETPDRFRPEDEEVVSSLAATAGIAIENARLFEEGRRRLDWLQASTEITHQLLSADGEEPLQLIARRTREMAAADAVNVVLPSGDGELMVEVAAGEGADRLSGLTYPREDTMTAQVLKTGQPVLVEDMGSQHLRVHLSEVVPIGALMVLPLAGTRRVRGVLLVGRLPGRPRFSPVDLDMAGTFAGHAALALELRDARFHQQRVALLEDRDRIARDLHDHVIQQLFAVGLSIESVAVGLGSDPKAARLASAVDAVDETIRRIRQTIFQLRGHIGPDLGQVRPRLLDVAEGMAPVLGFEPRVSFTGPVDAVVTEEDLDDLVAVVRETLANVARHARATRVDVDVTATLAGLRVEVTDDGVGLQGATRRSGLANLLRRAEEHHGSLQVLSPVRHPVPANGLAGTTVRWEMPRE